MRYKESKASVYEVIESNCPHCGADYKDRDIGWRDKYEKDGLAVYPARCQKTACAKIFKFRFY